MPPGSIRGSIFTLLVAIVGAGILSIPIAFRQAGLAAGLGLTALCAVMAFFSLHLLVESTSMSGHMSYISLGLYCGGPRLERLTQVCLLLNLLGTTVAYTIASGSLLSMALRAVLPRASASLYTSPKFLCVVLCAAVSLPLSLPRAVSALRFSSLVAILCSCYLAVVLAIEYAARCTSHTGGAECFWRAVPLEHWLPQSLPALFRALPIIVYAYTCHPNVLPIYVELQRPSEGRIHRVVSRSVFVAMALYACTGVCGFLSFLGDTQGNILDNDFHKAAPMVVAAFSMDVAVVSAIPLLVSAWRMNAEAGFFAHSPPSRLRHVALTVLPLGTALFIAVAVGKLAPVFSFLGATTNPVICYVLPAFFFLRTHDPTFRRRRLERGHAALLSCSPEPCTDAESPPRLASVVPAQAPVTPPTTPALPPDAALTPEGTQVRRLPINSPAALSASREAKLESPTLRVRKVLAVAMAALVCTGSAVSLLAQFHLLPE